MQIRITLVWDIGLMLILLQSYLDLSTFSRRRGGADLGFSHEIVRKIQTNESKSTKNVKKIPIKSKSY